MYGTYVGEDTMSDRDFAIERRARRIAVERLFGIQARLNNQLREPKPVESPVKRITGPGRSKRVLTMPLSKEQRQAQVEAEQEGMTREEIAAAMARKADYVLDLENVPRNTHRWVRRGIKVSCEGAGHPHHSHFLH
jgi:hypothetical protein